MACFITWDIFIFLPCFIADTDRCIVTVKLAPGQCALEFVDRMDLGVKLSKLQHQMYVGEVPPWGRFGFRWFSLSSTQLPGLAQECRKLESHYTVTFLTKVRAEAESGIYKRKSRDN